MNTSMLFMGANSQAVPAPSYTTQQGKDAPQVAHSKGLNRLLSAAVVSRKFCRLLLTDPTTALESGYGGESFALDQDERSRILAIRASSLESFASQLVDGAQADNTGVGIRRNVKAVENTRSPQSQPAVPAEDGSRLERRSPTTLVTEATTYLGKALNDLSLARHRAGLREPELEMTIRHAETAVQLATEPLLHLMRELAPSVVDYRSMGYGKAQYGD